MYNSFISGTGSYLPEKILSNKDLEDLVETNDQWITERTGIKTRHLASDSEATSDLAYHASQKAIQAADLKPTDIEMIILATVTPDQMMPSTACVVQERLGCKDVMAFDLTAACSGFLYALTIADQFIKAGTHKHILVIGAEALSRIINFKDRETCILFGDGAGAAVLSRAEQNSKSQVVSHHMRADGKLGHLLTLSAGGSRKPITHEILDNDDQYVEMKGREIFKYAIRTMASCCNHVLDSNKLNMNEIDWLIPHQANLRIIDAMAKQLNFPMEKIVVNLDHTGNTSAATIPIALDEAVREGKIQRGQNVLLTAFGAGLTSGSLLMRY